MTFIMWSADYETGNHDIDQDHRGLFALINDLHDKAKDGVPEESIGVTIEALVDYVNIHFEREEILMSACGYAGLENHKAAHRKLALRIRFHKDCFDRHPESFDKEDFMSFLAEWLSNHILVKDMDYVPDIKGTVSEARSKQ